MSWMIQRRINTKSQTLGVGCLLTIPPPRLVLCARHAETALGEIPPRARYLSLRDICQSLLHIGVTQNAKVVYDTQKAEAKQHPPLPLPHLFPALSLQLGVVITWPEVGWKLICHAEHTPSETDVSCPRWPYITQHLVTCRE